MSFNRANPSNPNIMSEVYELERLMIRSDVPDELSYNMIRASNEVLSPEHKIMDA